MERLEEYAEFAKMLASTTRLGLLECLMHNGELSVDELSQQCVMTVANTSQHLQQLKRAGFLVSRKDGKKVLYRMASEEIVLLISALKKCADQRRQQILQFYKDSHTHLETLESISREELVNRMLDGDVVLLDVRSQEEFDAGHLPGALHIPIEELDLRLSQLSKERMVVAYCRGPLCMLSHDAVEILRKSGVTASRLRDGFEAWQEAGLKTVS